MKTKTVLIVIAVLLLTSSLVFASGGETEIGNQWTFQNPEWIDINFENEVDGDSYPIPSAVPGRATATGTMYIDIFVGVPTPGLDDWPYDQTFSTWLPGTSAMISRDQDDVEESQTGTFPGNSSIDYTTIEWETTVDFSGDPDDYFVRYGYIKIKWAFGWTNVNIVD
jgi:hypothetical protein